MKFIIRDRLLSFFDDIDIDLLVAVGSKFSSFYTNDTIYLDKWGSYWICESDEGFPTYCMIKFGFKLFELLQTEYEILMIDNVVFLSKERSQKLKEIIVSMKLICDKK